MIDHVSIAVRNLDTARLFYDNVLATLAMERLVSRSHTVGYGKRYPEFWLNVRPQRAPVEKDTGSHICLRAPDREAVDAFHRSALACGGRCDGAPGQRQGAMTVYYGAFVRDIDGNKIEAVTFPKS